MIEKLQSRDYFHEGFKEYAFSSDQQKINEIIEALNKQEEAIIVLASNVDFQNESKLLFTNLINSILNDPQTKKN